MHRGPVFLDALTLTVPVLSSRRRALINWFNDQRNFPGVEGRSQFGRQPTGMYRFRYYIQLPRGECLVEIDPRFHGHFMRLDFNPSRSPGGLAPIIAVLREAIPDFSVEDILGGNATRIDIAFDLFGVDMEMIDALCRLRLRETARYRTFDMDTWERHGGLTAIVIGAKNAPSRFRIYDKKTQLEETNPGVPRMYRSRVRFELQERRWGPANLVGTGENAFDRYRVYQHDLLALRPPSTNEERFFRYAVQLRGAVALLSELENPRERRRYEQLLSPAAFPSYWQSDTLWREFQDAWQRLTDARDLQSIARPWYA